MVWASGPPETADNLHGYKGRGIGIFFANCLGEVVEKSEQIVRDPQGRFLAISCTLHGRPTLIVAAHADNNSDAEQEAFYKRLAQALEPFRPDKKPGMDYHFLMDTNNAPDWHLDYRSTASRTTQSRPLGIAAMQQLVQTIKVIDNFRELNPLRREYTRTHHLAPWDR